MIKIAEEISNFEVTEKTSDYKTRFISEGISHIDKIPYNLSIVKDENREITLADILNVDRLSTVDELSEDFYEDSNNINNYVSDCSSSEEDQGSEEENYNGPSIEPLTEGIISECIKSYNKKGKRYITTLSSLIILFAKDLKKFIYYDTDKSCLVWKNKEDEIVYDYDSSQLFEFIFSSFYQEIKEILNDQLENPDLEEEYEDIRSIKKIVKRVKKGDYYCRNLLGILRKTISKKEYFKGFS